MGDIAVDVLDEGQKVALASHLLPHRSVGGHDEDLI